RFFFFQAEDGIRDRNVTGVQTCALPISTRSGWAFLAGGVALLAGVRLARLVPIAWWFIVAFAAAFAAANYAMHRIARDPPFRSRSEERRVGKGWSKWGGREHKRSI